MSLLISPSSQLNTTSTNPFPFPLQNPKPLTHLSFPLSFTPKPLGLLPPRPNPISKPKSTSLFITSYSNNNISYSADGDVDVGDNNEEVQEVYPRPAEIPWSKELSNTVSLIGNIGAPVELRKFGSGKVLAFTRLGVKKSATDTSWINLTFWDDLAHIASQHIETGSRVHVSGRLVTDTAVDGNEDEKPKIYYKVVVQQINFVEKNYAPVSLYEQETSYTPTAPRATFYPGKTGASTQELWQAFFANPMDWWDNRKTKRTPKHPDFKHKDTGEALWVEAKYNPPWVESQLEVLDSKMESFNKPGPFMSTDSMF